MKETLYLHYKNNCLYRVLHSCQYQHEGEWYRAVCYQDINSLEIYVREESSFDECFSVVHCIDSVQKFKELHKITMDKVEILLNG